MRISDGSSDVCSSDLVCDHRGSWHGPSSDRLGIGVGGEAVAHALPLLAVPAIPLGTAGDIRDGHGAGLVELTGELAVDGVRPARGGDLVTGAGIARRSEEHPSELQSLMRISYAVFCLKKKTLIITI